MVSIGAELRAEFDRQERREHRAFQALPYCLLAVSVAVTLLQSLWDEPVRLVPLLGLSAAAALWLVWFHTLHPGRRSLLFFTGLTVLTAGLVAIAPWYGFFAVAGYPQAFETLRGRWRYAGATATSAVLALAFLGGVSGLDDDNLWWAWPLVSGVSAVMAGAMFSFSETAEHRNTKQKRALEELEAALVENAGLHAQLVVQAREAGVLDERQRMAREIHDTLAQGLAGILTQLQAAEQNLDERPVAGRHLANAMNLARESLTEARRTVHAVQPAVLAGTRLPDAIGEVARRWSEVHGIEAVLTTTGEARPMHTDVEVALLRAAQEALANVAKHAQARRVGLTLSYMEDLVTLDVRDDGIGFVPGAHRSTADGGFGLAGMRQRVQRLDGQLAIESEPGEGTAISATVPAIPAFVPGGAE